ncbi:hypothetical protein ABIE28_003237 [Devosia sp. 2618]
MLTRTVAVARSALKQHTSVRGTFVVQLIGSDEASATARNSDTEQATICSLLIFDEKEIRDVETQAARA